MADNRFRYGTHFLAKFPLDDLVLPPWKGARVLLSGVVVIHWFNPFTGVYSVLLQELIK